MFDVASGILGFPRIGARRELKWALERYWAGQGDEQDLLRQAAQIRRQNWQAQQRAGSSWVAVGDFSLYDHVLGLGIWDIHSPRVPPASEMLELLRARAFGTGPRPRLGQSGLWPQDAHLGRSAASAGQHGASGSGCSRTIGARRELSGL
jgi:hypothetical protein